MGAGLAEQGIDTWLAELLARRGKVPLDELRETLYAARAGRAAGGPTLAQLILQRGLLEQAELERCLEELSGDRREPVREKTCLGTYELGERLGAGGMAVVYAARHVDNGRRCAIKVLATLDPELNLRFQREGEAQARVDAHPNVVRVHAAGREGGRSYLVQELVTGGSLQVRLSQGALPWREAVQIAIALARGLAHVHACGVLHRDLKPENVLFDETGTPQLVDFGLARVAGEHSLTQTGEIMGTPSYMAPEQVKGDKAKVGEATDVYGLGAVLFHCLTGAAPFPGKRAVEVLQRVVREPAPRPSEQQPGVPAAVDAVCLRALAKRPADRFSTAEAFGTALARAVEAPNSNRALSLMPVAAFAALVAVTALIATRPPGPPPSLGSTRATEQVRPHPTAPLEPTPPAGRGPLPVIVLDEHAPLPPLEEGEAPLATVAEETQQVHLLALSCGDPAPARRLFEAAATRGHVPAMRELAKAYRDGTGGERDLRWAQAWIEAGIRRARRDPEEFQHELRNLRVMLAEMLLEQGRALGEAAELLRLSTSGDEYANLRHELARALLEAGDEQRGVAILVELARAGVGASARELGELDGLSDPAARCLLGCARRELEAVGGPEIDEYELWSRQLTDSERRYTERQIFVSEDTPMFFAERCRRLATLRRDGLDGRPDLTRAIELFTLAARAGSSVAAEGLAELVLDRADRGEVEALEDTLRRAVLAADGAWHRAEVEIELADVVSFLGRHEAAREYYWRPADRDNREAKVAYARTLIRGQGGPRDAQAGLDWLDRAARRPRPDAGPEERADARWENLEFLGGDLKHVEKLREPELLRRLAGYFAEDGSLPPDPVRVRELLELADAIEQARLLEER